MISVEEARARVIGQLRALPVETVSLAQGWGRVLASPVTARVTHPPANMSAMDGYALRAIDGRPGTTLKVVGASPAGRPWVGQVGSGEAVRLFTGSVLPDGADTVVLQEDVVRTGDTVGIAEQASIGRHIRLAGQDFNAGDILLHPGRRLGARDIGLAAAANYPWLNVHRRPRIAILATGDEIAMPGEPIVAGAIVSSNTHALAALVRAGGGEPLLIPVVPDDEEAIGAVVSGLGGVDLLVTTGGASVGDHDLVLAALRKQGLVLDFWKVAMRPGKPVMAGRVADTPMIGLPGNPVSALICAILFLLPSIAVLSGLSEAVSKTERALAGADLPQNDLRTDYLRATLATTSDGVTTATPFPRQDSGMLSTLSLADALLLRPPHALAAPRGSVVDVIRLDTLGL